MTVDQTIFVEALLAPDAPHPTGLSDGVGQPAGRRFDVYRNNVAVSLSDALETAFPVIHKLVGNGNFRLLAGAFLRQYPPSSPLMMHYGAEMPEFLATFEPTKPLGYLPDIARLEVALRESYHAADADAIDPADLQSVPPETLMTCRLILAPSLRLVRSQWPVHAIWRFNMDNGPKPNAVAEDVVVLRSEMDPEPVLLPPGGGIFLQAVLEGALLGVAFETTANTISEFDLTENLALLIGAQAITELRDRP